MVVYAETVSQSVVTKVAATDISPAEFEGIIASHFMVIRHKRAAVGRIKRAAVEKFSERKRLLERNVIVSTKGKDNKDNPSALLRMLKPPVLPFAPCLADRLALRAQVEEQFREALRRASVPQIVIRSVESSIEKDVALTNFKKEVKEVMKDSKKQLERARRIMSMKAMGMCSEEIAEALGEANETAPGAGARSPKHSPRAKGKLSPRHGTNSELQSLGSSPTDSPLRSPRKGAGSGGGLRLQGSGDHPLRHNDANNSSNSGSHLGSSQQLRTQKPPKAAVAKGKTSNVAKR